MTDAEWMRHVLDLAGRGTGHVSPNPRVGCVIVDREGIIAEGWHEQYGGPHAEAMALANLTRPLTSDAVMYVNLEPCSHHGKQPPCANAIVASGIKRVVVGMLDPNPLVGGSGVRLLQDHGINVTVGTEAAACEWLNRSFSRYITRGLPYVIAKIARTVNGTMAPLPYRRQELTGVGARTAVHALRGEVDAVMVGSETVLVDDPQLNVRAVPGRNPIRVVVDTHLRTPPTSRIVTTAISQRSIVYTSEGAANTERADILRARGVEIRCVPQAHTGHLELAAVLSDLASLQIASILSEGGPVLSGALIDAGLADEVRLYCAATIEPAGVALATHQRATAWRLHDASIVDNDILAIYLPRG